MNSLGNKRVELFDMGAGVSEPTAEDNVQMASSKFALYNILGYKVLMTYDDKQFCILMLLHYNIQVDLMATWNVLVVKSYLLM